MNTHSRKSHGTAIHKGRLHQAGRQAACAASGSAAKGTFWQKKKSATNEFAAKPGMCSLSRPSRHLVTPLTPDPDTQRQDNEQYSRLARQPSMSLLLPPTAFCLFGAFAEMHLTPRCISRQRVSFCVRAADAFFAVIVYKFI
jgi:hypothetical protein